MNLSKFEATYHHYGVCPICGEARQPDDYDQRTETELVICCDCGIWWSLHHEGQKDNHLEEYKISDIEHFGVYTPYGCRES